VPLNPYDPDKHHIALGDVAAYNDPVLVLASSKDLRGYWKLGESWPGPYADSKPPSMWANAPMTPFATSRDGSTSHVRSASGALLAGQDDGAVEFTEADGVGAFLQTANTWGTIMSNPFDGVRTICGWIRPRQSSFIGPGGVSLKGGMWSTAHESVGYTGGVSVFVDHRTMQLCAWNGNNRLYGPFLAPDQWYFVTLIRDDTTLKLYVDGFLAAEGPSGSGSMATSNNVNPIIGLWNQSAHGPPYYSPTQAEYPGSFYGMIDEVSVWGGILYPDEIRALWQAPSLGDPDAFWGFTLENAYAKFMQREVEPGTRDVGGTLDLIAPKPDESTWTQDEFTGGTFQFRYDTDAAMFADCTSYVPSQQSRSLCTVPPVFFKKAFNPTAQANPAGRSNLTNPSSMFTVAGSIFVCFEHGILRYITGTDSFVWGNQGLGSSGDLCYYVGADYDRNEQCIYVLVGHVDPIGHKPFFMRLDPETLLLWKTTNQYFNNAPDKVEDSPPWGFQINDQNLVVGIGWRLYTVDPPVRPQDATDKPLWTHIGRLPGRWVDSVAYNGMTYILTATADGKTDIVAFDGTYILPIANMAFNFRGTCMTVYGGRVYIGGSGTDINGVNRYAELHELTGSSTRLVRTFAPESRQSRVTYPKEIWDLTVAEGLLWWSERDVRLWTYDLTGDAFFGASVIQHPGVNFYRHVVGRERLWFWGAHDTIPGQHGFYRIPIAGDTVAGYEGLFVTSDFSNDFALDKQWHEIVVLTRYYPATQVDYSNDGGATWHTTNPGTPSDTGDLHFLTVDLSKAPSSRAIRFRIHQPMGTEVTGSGELIAFTVSFTVKSSPEPLKHGWNIIINGAENVEARDGSNQYQDVDAMKRQLWGWAEARAKLTYKDLGGANYMVKLQDFVEQQPIIGPNVTDGENPEAYFAITLMETNLDED
jgi:Concanavalin A-like lectin/glucanases superfamily/Reelin subrepeat B